MASRKSGSGGKKPPVHMGFKAVEASVAAKGARNPAAVAAAIGRKKYGAAGMAALSAAGRKKTGGKRKGGK